MVTIEATPEAVTLDPLLSAARAAIDATRSLLLGARDAGLTVVYVRMEYEPELSDAGAPNRVKHRPLGLDAGDVLIRDTWGTAIVRTRPSSPDLHQPDRGASRHFAYSTARLSRMTVTLIWPGYSSWPSISRAISCERRTAWSSSISAGLTITRISRPACSA
jgi:hypothetical protein